MPESSPELRSARTAAARAALEAKFERQIDPNGTLAAAERDRRVEAARRAYYLRLNIKSIKARRAKGLLPAEPRPARPPVEQRIAELERLAAGGES